MFVVGSCFVFITRQISLCVVIAADACSDLQFIDDDAVYNKMHARQGLNKFITPAPPQQQSQLAWFDSDRSERGSDWRSERGDGVCTLTAGYSQLRAKQEKREVIDPHEQWSFIGSIEHRSRQHKPTERKG